MINKLSNQVLLNNGENINLQLYIDRLIGSTINRVLFGFAFDDVGNIILIKNSDANLVLDSPVLTENISEPALDED